MSRTEKVKSRTLWTLAAFALVVLIIAGCSNAPAETGSSSDTNTAAPVEPGAGSNDGNNTAVPAKTVTDSSDDNSTASIHEQGIKFAECMRENGVSEFPDPDASGELTMDGIANGSSLDTSTAAFTQALSACKDLEPPGFTGQKRSPEDQENALKFAQCIRDNGVKDFPDPLPDGPLVDTNRIPSSAGNGGMSILNAAMRKCGDIIADQLRGP